MSDLSFVNPSKQEIEKIQALHAFRHASVRFSNAHLRASNLDKVLGWGGEEKILGGGRGIRQGKEKRLGREGEGSERG